MSCRVFASSLLFVLSLLACGGASGPVPPGSPPWEPGGDDWASYDAVLVSTSQPPTLDKDAWGAQKVSRGPLVVHTDPGDLPRLRIAGEGEKSLPLEKTRVRAHLSGFVASVEVAQTFSNPSPRPIEVVYVFPLPENSAVGAMEMRIADRVVRAKIDERGAARRTYERARRRGHTAALLEQERPNIFTQSVANIAPGEKIDVVVRYVQDLTYDAGSYEFVFPMVVGPRFVPGTPLAAAMSGSGTYHDTTRVPDASRISPPVLGKGERSGHDISIEIVADNTLPVSSWETPTHVVAHKVDEGTLQLRLAEHDNIPNRDFVLRYQVAGDEPRATLLTSGEPENGHFALLVHPPNLDVDALVGARELIFVLDVSGSMSGTPLGMCKRAMRKALSRLRPVDTFNIITFAGASRKAFPSALPANRTSLDFALKFVGAARAGGGTHMAEGVRAALEPSVPAGRHRYVFFLTDGFVGDEAAIISGSSALVETLEGRGQRARVFGFGVGSSPNRHLLEGLSKAGHGVAVYATNREDPERGVNTFFRYIDRAVLTDVRLAWADAQASELYPQPMPDLFASHPIVVHGRYRHLSDTPAVVHARIGERAIQLPVAHRKSTAPGFRGGLVGRLWARSKVAHLEEESWLGMVHDAREQITRIGLEYELVTPYTSFVAVDESRRVGDGDPDRVVQPVEVPEAVDGRAAGARARAPRNSLHAPLAAKPKPTPVPGQWQSSGADRGALDGPPRVAQATPTQPGYAPPSDAEPLEDDEEAESVSIEELSTRSAPASAPGQAAPDFRGCGCHTVGTDPARSWPVAIGLLMGGLAWMRRRRRR
jgi:Ca-activated chloride channel homolog